MPDLTILGAAYGLGCRTAQMRSIQSEQGNSDTVKVTANNKTFGDTWKGEDKSLVIVYQYSGYPSMVSITQEGDTVTISPPDYAAPGKQNPKGFLALGAAYGLGDVTDKTNSHVQDNALEITANNDTFFDSWKGKEKSYVAVFNSDGGNPYMVIVKEGTYISVSDQ